MGATLIYCRAGRLYGFLYKPGAITSVDLICRPLHLGFIGLGNYGNHSVLSL